MLVSEMFLISQNVLHFIVLIDSFISAFSSFYIDIFFHIAFKVSVWKRNQDIES